MSDKNFKISLDNFQSIESADLTFDEGITVIQGQSNSGKTAILRAIKSALLNNSKAKAFIKQGAKSTEVKITYEDTDILWSRTAKTSHYEVDGEPYDKMGNKTVFDHKEDTGFVQDHTKALMNLEDEWELPFPYGRTSSDLFKLFENVFSVSDSAVVLRGFKEEVDNINKNKNNTEYNVEVVDRKLNALDTLEKEVDLNKLKEGKKLLTETYERIVNLERANTKLKNNITFINEFKDLKEEYFSDEDILRYSQLQKVKGKVTNYARLHKVLKTEEVDYPEEVEKCIKKYLMLRKAEKKLSELKVQEDLDLQEKEYSNEDIDDYYCRLKVHKKIQEALKEMKSKTEEIKKLEEDVNKCEVELKKIDKCPLCGNIISKNGD